jgi:hypothetical protein
MPRRYSAGVGAVHYKRVIPCMDVDDGRVVKGTRFIRDARDPVELAAHYDAEGADVLIFFDITATSDKRATMVELARRVAPATAAHRVRAWVSCAIALIAAVGRRLGNPPSRAAASRTRPCEGSLVPCGSAAPPVRFRSAPLQERPAPLHILATARTSPRGRCRRTASPRRAG